MNLGCCDGNDTSTSEVCNLLKIVYLILSAMWSSSGRIVNSGTKIM